MPLPSRGLTPNSRPIVGHINYWPKYCLVSLSTLRGTTHSALVCHQVFICCFAGTVDEKIFQRQLMKNELAAAVQGTKQGAANVSAIQ